ncbi:MAG: NAD(P)H-dependent oxidoreductase [Rhizomicrobium sp.]
MKHAVIVAHPDARSFTASVAQIYCETARAQGHCAMLRDLYRMNFAPCLAAEEIPKPAGFAPGRDVQDERRILQDVDVFAFVYPFWMNAQPAMLKGYIDRVFGMGFAYNTGKGGSIPLLKSREMISFTSSGAPTGWVRKSGAWDATRKLFDEHFADVCGMKVIDHIHFGAVYAGMRADAVDMMLGRVRTTVSERFGPAVSSTAPVSIPPEQHIS